MNYTFNGVLFVCLFTYLPIHFFVWNNKTHSNLFTQPKVQNHIPIIITNNERETNNHEILDD